MIAALDVHYSQTNASAAAVVFESWDSERPVGTYAALTQDCGDYSPGQFYLRELRPLLAVISEIREDVSVFVIDGYCHLSKEGKSGLGVHLAESLPGGRTIIGVAKNRFRDSEHAVEVLRGGSERPLFVTAIGLDYEAAASKIASMHGSFRVPTLLKEADRLSRTTNSERGSSTACPPRDES
jgi:deoxyribonuclease V